MITAATFLAFVLCFVHLFSPLSRPLDILRCLGWVLAMTVSLYGNVTAGNWVSFTVAGFVLLVFAARLIMLCDNEPVLEAE
jgi:heme A synthase